LSANATECEQAVLSLASRDPRSRPRIFEVFRLEDFRDKGNRLVFATMAKLYREHRKFDDAVLLAACRKQEPERAPVMIADACGRHQGSAESLADYADVLIEQTAMRRLSALADGLKAKAADLEAVSSDLVDTVVEELNDYRKRTSREHKVTAEEVAKRVFERIDHTAQSAGEYATGISDLDKMLFVRPGAMVVVAGRPSMGKTSFANTIKLAWLKRGIPCVDAPIETGPEESASMMACSIGKVDTLKALSGDMNEADCQRFIVGMGSVASYDVDFYDGSEIEGIEAMAMDMHRKHGRCAVFVDFIQRAKFATKPKNMNREQELGEMSRRLADLAKTLNVPVVVLSQLNRGAEYRESKRPRMSDLRESGAIEQDADAVLLLYRDDYYSDDQENQPITSDVEVIIGKQKYGPTGVVRLAFVKNHAHFYGGAKPWTEQRF